MSPDKPRSASGRIRVRLIPYTALNDGKVILSSVVKALGEFLTAEEEGTRLKGELHLTLSIPNPSAGLTLLSNVIKTMSSQKINRAASESNGHPT